MPRGARRKIRPAYSDAANALSDSLGERPAAAATGVPVSRFRAWSQGRGTISRSEEYELRWAAQNEEQFRTIVLIAEGEGHSENKIVHAIRRLRILSKLGDNRFRRQRKGPRADPTITEIYSGKMPLTSRRRVVDIMLGIDVPPSGLLAVYFQPRGIRTQDAMERRKRRRR